MENKDKIESISYIITELNELKKGFEDKNLEEQIELLFNAKIVGISSRLLHLEEYSNGINKILSSIHPFDNSKIKLEQLITFFENKLNSIVK